MMEGDQRLSLYHLSYIMAIIVSSMAGVGCENTTRIEHRTAKSISLCRYQAAKSISLYRYVVLTDGLDFGHKQKIKEEFIKSGFDVVPTYATFLSDANADSRDTCRAHILIDKLINTTVTVMLTDYLTGDKIWASSEISYLDDSIRSPLYWVMDKLRRDRYGTNPRKAAVEHQARHHSAEDTQMMEELKLLAAQANALLEPEGRQRVAEHLHVLQTQGSRFDRVPIFHDLSNIGKNAIVSALPVLITQLITAEDVDLTLGILTTLLEIPEALPASLLSTIKIVYRDPDEEVKLLAKRLIHLIEKRVADKK